MMTLYGHPGWGSTIIEAQLQFYGLEYTFADAGNVFMDQSARRKLMTLNGVAQVPTLVMTDGSVMTESAAITLYLADMAKKDDLVPGPDHAARAKFLRWLIFIVANIYPTFTYVDDPARFVTVTDAQEDFSNQVGAYRKRLWRMVESEAQQPYFLGARLSALDLYLAVMLNWRPRMEWFDLNTPQLAAIGRRVWADARFKDALLRNFPESPLRA